MHNNIMIPYYYSSRRHRNHRRVQQHIGSICAATLFIILLLAIPTHQFTHTGTTTRKTSSTPPYSPVIQQYRTTHDEEYSSNNSVPQPSSSGDAFSLLPSRLNVIQRIDSQKQLQAQIDTNESSLIVVRFYAEVCPSCKATRPLFSKWSRDIEAGSYAKNVQLKTSIIREKDDEVDMQTTAEGIGSSTTTQNIEEEQLTIKILEMPLNKATSTFIRDELQISQLPYCHIYHPQFGLIEKQLVMNKVQFKDFTSLVGSWSKGVYEANLDTLIKSTSRR